MYGWLWVLYTVIRVWMAIELMVDDHALQHSAFDDMLTCFIFMWYALLGVYFQLGFSLVRVRSPIWSCFMTWWYDMRFVHDRSTRRLIMVLICPRCMHVLLDAVYSQRYGGDLHGWVSMLAYTCLVLLGTITRIHNDDDNELMLQFIKVNNQLHNTLTKPSTTTRASLHE